MSNEGRMLACSRGRCGPCVYPRARGCAPVPRVIQVAERDVAVGYIVQGSLVTVHTVASSRQVKSPAGHAGYLRPPPELPSMQVGTAPVALLNG